MREAGITDIGGPARGSRLIESNPILGTGSDVAERVPSGRATGVGVRAHPAKLGSENASAVSGV